MTPTPIVERVARALFESDMKWAPIVEHQFEENRQMYFAAARAAIDAMREPGSAVIEAGQSVPWDERTATEMWRVMIDAALGRGGV